MYFDKKNYKAKIWNDFVFPMNNEIAMKKNILLGCWTIERKIACNIVRVCREKFDWPTEKQYWGIKPVVQTESTEKCSIHTWTRKKRKNTKKRLLEIFSVKKDMANNTILSLSRCFFLRVFIYWSVGGCCTFVLCYDLCTCDHIWTLINTYRNHTRPTCRIFFYKCILLHNDDDVDDDGDGQAHIAHDHAEPCVFVRTFFLSVVFLYPN